MRILVTGFEWFGDLVPFVTRALVAMDHLVRVVPTNGDQLVRHRARLLRRVDDIPLVGGSLAGRWRTHLAQDAVAHISDNFRREVDRFRPEVVLSLLCWGEPLTADVLAYASRAIRIGWLMDDPFGYTDSRLDRLLGSFDRLYSPDDGWSDNIERMTGRRPQWLPCGADPDSHGPLDPSKIDRDLSGRVVYVGSSCVDHPTGTFRRSLIESLRGLPLAVFGDPGWKEHEGYAADCYQGGPVTTERANAIYASGAVALNFHHPQFRRGTSLRTFALCCAGAFQLVDWRDGLDRWLTPGIEIETFHTPAELRRKVERYLGDPAARSQVAEAGRKRVLAEHTYRHRLNAMLDGLDAARRAGLELPAFAPGATADKQEPPYGLKASAS